jgi:cation-transporting ATPase 13A3/4/5
MDSSDNNGPIVVYIYYAVWYLFMAMYYVSKRGGSAPSGSTESLFGGDLTMTGYKDTSVGKFLLYLYHSYTLVFIVIYLLLIFDTYWMCQLKGPDNLCFKGQKPITGTGTYPEKYSGSSKNEDGSSKDDKNKYPPNINQVIFFWCWCTGVSWAIFNYFYGSKVANHFRTQCAFDEATHVLCKRKGKTVVMSNPNRWVKYSRALSKTFFGGEAEQYHEGTSAVVALNGAKSIIFMCSQYAFNGQSFELANVSIDTTYPGLRAAKGLTAGEQINRQNAVGKNVIPFSTDSFFVLLGAELASYLYIYQLTFFLVWLWFGGLIWCSPQMIVVVVCASMSIKITKQNQEKIQQIGESGMDSSVQVRTDGAWVSKPSSDLVPGDLVLLNGSNLTLPCDLVVVEGTCICDESGLTGESMPVRKAGVPTTAGDYSAEKDTGYTLFAGTILLEAVAGEGSTEDGALAVVTQTGIRTAKGDLVSAILYPASMIFEYDEELKIVFTLLSFYAAALFGVSVWLQYNISPMNWVSIFAFACFTISQILPPLLPVSLVIGHTKSANRLKTKGILCVEPKRIAISGKIHAFMFDKTGTLTKQGLDFIGIHSAEKATFDPAGHKVYSAEAAPAGDLMSWAIATAHAVQYSTKGIAVGNQVEVQMFTGSGWSLSGSDVTSPNTDEKLTIVKRFEFDHHSMTMSVVVRDASGNCHVFCKGAPERVAELCTDESIPADFQEVSSGHALEGCYVIGMSHKAVGNLTQVQIDQMVRAEAESKGSLTLLGLLLFRNELKPDTADAIAKIKEGDVRPVMVTGDNAHCGYYIARQSRIVESQRIFLSDAKLVDGQVTFSDMEPGSADKGVSAQQMLQLCEQSQGKIECAITGKAMKVLTEQNMIHAFLLVTRIFARVQPDQKVQVIQLFIDRGYITGMCGDGGNDCGALRSAHCGIALSEAEASVVSPFTSKTKSIQSVVDVLCEGRCALTTSFAAYRFYITYGLNWSIVKTINFAYGVRMPIAAYLTIDSICSWLCAWAITGSQPLDRLGKYRPTSSLFAPNIFWSVIAPWLVNMGLMSIMLTVVSSEHEDHVTMHPQLTKGVGYWELGDTWESTIFTYFQVCPLIWCGVCYSLGTKFRKSLVANTPMLLVWGVIFVVYSIVLLAEPGKFTAFFHVASNAHNGFDTASPVWMRYQFPEGCPNMGTMRMCAEYGGDKCNPDGLEGPDNTWCESLVCGGSAGNSSGGAPAWARHAMTGTTLEYNMSVGMNSWRTAYVGGDGLPNNCLQIKNSVAKCGGKDACGDHEPGTVTPGMPSDVRGTLFAFVVIGMVFMMGAEYILNKMYIKEADFMVDGSVQQAEVTGYSAEGKSLEGVSHSEPAFQHRSPPLQSHEQSTADSSYLTVGPTPSAQVKVSSV